MGDTAILEKQYHGAITIRLLDGSVVSLNMSRYDDPDMLLETFFTSQPNKGKLSQLSPVALANLRGELEDQVSNMLLNLTCIELSEHRGKPPPERTAKPRAQNMYEIHVSSAHSQIPSQNLNVSEPSFVDTTNLRNQSTQTYRYDFKRPQRYKAGSAYSEPSLSKETRLQRTSSDADDLAIGTSFYSKNHGSIVAANVDSKDNFQHADTTRSSQGFTASLESPDTKEYEERKQDDIESSDPDSNVDQEFEHDNYSTNVTPGATSISQRAQRARAMSIPMRNNDSFTFS